MHIIYEKDFEIMKKLLTVVIVMIALFIPNVTYASGINVTVDGERIVFPSQSPVIVDERTLVPVRAVFEFIGFGVAWDEHTRTVTLARDNDIVNISIGSNVFITNNRPYALDVPAQIIGGSTMLPIRAVLESVGYYVGWEASTNTVLISNKSPAPSTPQLEQISIPNRRLTPDEITAWINNYNTLGAANDFEREVIRLVNIERANAGLLPLSEYPTLMMAARFKAQGMFELDYFSHVNPVYGRFDSIAREVFGMPARAMGENIARGQRTPESVVQGWLNSDGHRDNILNSAYTRIGVGFYNNNWVQKFSS